MLGTLAGVAWNEEEGLWYAVIADPRDRRRFTLASTLWLDESGAIASNLTPYQFRRLPELPRQR